MTLKRPDAKRKTRRSLTLNKETIRDLSPKTNKGGAVRGGRATNSKEGMIKCQ